MKINRLNFVKFLKSLAVSGDFENNELVLDFSKGSLKVLSVSVGKHVAICGSMKDDFEAIGKIAIDNVSNFISLLNSISSDTVEITNVENKLILQSKEDKLQAKFTAKNMDYVINSISEDKFNQLLNKATTNSSTIANSIIAKIISYTNSVKADNIKLIVNKKEITVDVDNGEQSIEATFDLDKEVNKASIKLNTAVVTVLKLLEADSSVVMGINEDAPFLVKNISKNNYETTYLVALLKK